MLLMELDTLSIMKESEKEEKIKEWRLIQAFKKIDKNLEDVLCHQK